MEIGPVETVEGGEEDYYVDMLGYGKGKLGVVFGTKCYLYSQDLNEPPEIVELSHNGVPLLIDDVKGTSDKLLAMAMTKNDDYLYYVCEIWPERKVLYKLPRHYHSFYPITPEKGWYAVHEKWFFLEKDPNVPTELKARKDFGFRGGTQQIHSYVDKQGLVWNIGKKEEKKGTFLYVLKDGEFEEIKNNNMTLPEYLYPVFESNKSLVLFSNRDNRNNVVIVNKSNYSVRAILELSPHFTFYLHEDYLYLYSFEKNRNKYEPSAYVFGPTEKGHYKAKHFLNKTVKEVKINGLNLVKLNHFHPIFRPEKHRIQTFEIDGKIYHAMNWSYHASRIDKEIYPFALLEHTKDNKLIPHPSASLLTASYLNEDWYDLDGSLQKKDEVVLAFHKKLPIRKTQYRPREAKTDFILDGFFDDWDANTFVKTGKGRFNFQFTSYYHENTSVYLAVESQDEEVVKALSELNGHIQDIEVTIAPGYGTGFFMNQDLYWKKDGFYYDWRIFAIFKKDRPEDNHKYKIQLSPDGRTIQCEFYMQRNWRFNIESNKLIADVLGDGALRVRLKVAGVWYNLVENSPHFYKTFTRFSFEGKRK